MKKLYLITRDLHLYAGLFLCPFVVAFATSVFFLVHAWVPGADGAAMTRTVSALRLPENLQSLSGRARVDALRPVLNAAGVTGEIMLTRYVAKQRHLEVDVSVPGRQTAVDIDLSSASAQIVSRNTGVWDGLVALHKLPGPHLADIRKNWMFMRLWGWLADATVYGLLFITISGLYLWYALRAERRIGMILLAAGAFSFFGIIYALSY